MTLKQLQKEVPAKISKFHKLKNLQDAIVNLKACAEGISPLLREALETVQAFTPAEHVFNDGNQWEVK